ncbi:MAG: isoprenylcysteine carboxylmethyltransferase family protein [Gammaproteobacteria bacterium]|nr:isoprenylcysteine carboxylmethyltransferase family protein [Gammaproteobacteria bacterium]
MKLILDNLIFIFWAAWLVYWALASRKVKSAVRRESPLSRAGHAVPLLIAALLLALPSLPIGWLAKPLYPMTAYVYWASLAVTAAGLAFSVWARVHLAGNWSGIVTLKQDHELVRSGPYRLVRNPIYTGLLLAFIGTAMARDQWRGWLAVAIAFAALWRKLRLEERWLEERFGIAYRLYRQHVAALIPYLL